MKQIKEIQKVIITSLLAVLFFFSAQSQTAVESWGQLRVEGPDIVNEDGEKVQLQGMSLFWSQWQPSFYEYNTIKWLRDDWCANIIRPALGVEDNGNPYVSLEYQLNMARKVIDASIDLNIYVLVDYHAHYAPRNKETAKTFFRTIAQEYGQHPNIIYEIFNEPLGYDWNALKSYHEEIIGEIRKYDPDNIIVCGTPQWSSYPDAPIGNAINQPNIAYTLHYYAASHFQEYRNRANAARSNGLCVFVTEYGLVNADGDGNVNEGSSRDWWNWMNDNKISHCNWSLGNKDEGASALTPGTPAGGFWQDNQLTWSGGLVRANLKNNCPEYKIKVPRVTNIPNRLEAESYSKMLGIQKENTTDIGGGQNIGYLDANDWLEYKVLANGSGEYAFNYRLASTTGSSFKLWIDGSEIHTVTVPATGDWQIWTNVEKKVTLSAGEHTFKIVAIGGNWNFNYIDITATNLIDCNGDANGNAIIDNCGVCAGGNTGIVVNACEGNCNSGISAKGIKDDFTLEKDPFVSDGGVFSWGESTLTGDDNPNFQAIVKRNISKEALEIKLTQGAGEYIPFGFSFGDNPLKTIDLSTNSDFEIQFKNNSTDNLNVSLALKDDKGKIVNTYAEAKDKTFNNAWMYAISTSLNAGASITFKGDFTNALFANYVSKTLESNFDFTKVASILITVTNQKTNGSPNFSPLALNQVNLDILDIKLGDCSNATNDNLKDCNGDLNGTASIDLCGVCSGGKTSIEPNDCNLTSTEDYTELGFTVYPNPVQNSVSLSIATDWVLYNQTGNLIASGTGDFIELSGFAKGLYFVQSSFGTVKIIKE